VTRRLRREDEPEAEREEAAATAPGPPALLDLQRSAGNAAVARVLARQPLAGPSLQYRPPTLDPAVEAAVDRFLTAQASGIKIVMLEGRISMPEVIDRVRREVPEAATAAPEAIRGRVYQIVGAVPETQGKPSLGSRQAEQRSRISNLFPKVPTSVTFGSSQTSVTIGISGAELKTTGVTAKAGKEGPEVELKEGPAKVGVKGKWDGSEFGLKTEVHGVKFESKVQRKGEGWGWSGGLVIPIAGDEVDELPDIEAAVGGAHAALTESIGHIQGGGSPTDSFVTDRMGKIKPAIDAVGGVAERKGKSGATLRITGSADGGGWTAGVSLVIVF
jgi:hypothetical protein